MAREIERKFLVDKDYFNSLIDASFPNHTVSIVRNIEQAYLTDISSETQSSTVRVRLNSVFGGVYAQPEYSAFITVKSNSLGIARDEYEYEIPYEDAIKMVESLSVGNTITKTRYNIVYNEHVIEVDVFGGDNEGLVVAEVEFSSEDEDFLPPDWFGMEVTDDKRFFNINLLNNPYNSWEK